jgi:hypothetical protein
MKRIQPVNRLAIMGAMLALPVLTAGAAELCLPGPVTRESYTWNFKSETNEIFDDIRVRAYRVQDRAASLESFTRSLSQPGWQSHAGELTQVKTQVNAMGEELCRLHTIRRVTEPWQQNAIDHITPRIVKLAARTESMIDFVNEHRQNLVHPDYRDDAIVLYEQSKALRKIADQGYEVADAGEQEEDIALMARNYCGF